MKAIIIVFGLMIGIGITGCDPKMMTAEERNYWHQGFEDLGELHGELQRTAGPDPYPYPVPVYIINK